MPRVSALARIPAPAAIRTIRDRAGWTQEQAARSLRCGSFTTFQRWEYGKAPMPEAVFELFVYKAALARSPFGSR